MAPVFNSLLVLLSCVVLGYAHNIQLRAHSRECFHEMLHADDRMTVTFQVGDREFGGSGNLDLDFWVSGIASCLEGWALEDGLDRDKKRVDIGHREQVVLDKTERYAGLHEAILAVMRERAYADVSLSPQIQNPSNAFEVYERSVSSGDHSFTAAHDGKFEYCFSNEHWSANSKEVSFNVHGIVYVPESEAPQDPLEKEGECYT
jgi:hypothetical protein